jgi:hypothetical protein
MMKDKLGESVWARGLWIRSLMDVKKKIFVLLSVFC